MRRCICLLMFLSITVSVFAFDIKMTAPSFTAADPSNTVQVELVNQLNSALAFSAMSIEEDLHEITGGINSEPKDFIQAWGNAGIFASHGATQRAYSGYRIVTFTIGSTLGLQFPVNPTQFIDDPGFIITQLNDSGDISLGLSPQFLNAQIGFNLSFLVNNLYLGIRAGYFRMPGIITGFKYNSGTIGVLANYQLLPRINLFGLIDWKGVTLGTGLIYQGTELGLRLPLGEMSIDVLTAPSDFGNVTMTVDPHLLMNMDINTFTIPLEAMTALKLVFLNIPLGVGLDIGFGKSEMRVGMESEIAVSGVNPSYAYSEDNGELSVKAGGAMPPMVFNIKLMTGIGFSMGPVIIDFPFTYYFRGNGFGFGMTLGVSL